VQRGRSVGQLLAFQQCLIVAVFNIQRLLQRGEPAAAQPAAAQAASAAQSAAEPA
jgi:hypothetical protein